MGGRNKAEAIVNARLDEIREWVEAGEGRTAIAKKLGISVSTLYHCIRKVKKLNEIVYGNRKEPTGEGHYQMQFSTHYDNILGLCGAVIKSAVDDYVLAYYHKLKRCPKYIHPIRKHIVYTNDELNICEQFFTDGGLEFWGDGMLNPDYIRSQAEKQAMELYEMEKKIQQMTTQELIQFVKLANKEIKKRTMKK